MSTLLDDLIKNTDYEKEYLREQRKSLLKAFDIYKTNVQYGIENETEEEHQSILEWYERILDLNIEYFKWDNIPEKIKYYR